MKHLSRYSLRIRVLMIRVLMGTFIVALFFMPNYTRFKKGGDNCFTVYMYGENVGVVARESDADELLAKARRALAARNNNLVLLEPMDYEIKGQCEIFSTVNTDREIIRNMTEVMQKHERGVRRTAYTMKVRGITINMATASDIRTLLEKIIEKYDVNDSYEVVMEKDENRDLNVLNAFIRLKEDQDGTVAMASGSGNALENADKAIAEAYDLGFEDYSLGIQDLDLSDNIEIVESSVSSDEISSVEQALALLTEDQAVIQTYEVQPGDTLSAISLKLNIPMETIAEMNKDYMENGVNSTIHVGQSLIITVPEPELAVEWVNREHYSETFEADVEYVDNDEWFTNQTQVLQQPVAGYRELIADVHYSNDDEVSREIVKQDVLMEAVPKIVERGTMIPPTFIWPLSGGRISSYFGRRKSPTAGASSYHKGIDIATPTGSSVYASSGGVVTSAGWNGGYGYAVVIRHPDGHSTRYGHLSKILVSVGQSVSQGQTIARSGSTGVSTGPHLHFEIIENGVQVDPLPFIR